MAFYSHPYINAPIVG